jgi:hypothetical protein
MTRSVLKGKGKLLHPPPFSASTSTTGDWKVGRCSSCDRVNHSIWCTSFAPFDSFALADASSTAVQSTLPVSCLSPSLPLPPPQTLLVNVFLRAVSSPPRSLLSLSLHFHEPSRSFPKPASLEVQLLYRGRQPGRRQHGHLASVRHCCLLKRPLMFPKRPG